MATKIFFKEPQPIIPHYLMHISLITLLAYFDADQLAKFALKDMAKFTEYTCADIQTLQVDLAKIRARGFAIDDQERNIGMRCIAAPIRNAYGEVIAGISVSGPTSRVSGEQINRFSVAVMQAASKISTAMGAQDVMSMAEVESD